MGVRQRCHGGARPAARDRVSKQGSGRDEQASHADLQRRRAKTNGEDERGDEEAELRRDGRQSTVMKRGLAMVRASPMWLVSYRRFLRHVARVKPPPKYGPNRGSMLREHRSVESV